VDSRAVLDVVVRRKIPSHCRESNPRAPIVWVLRRIFGSEREEVVGGWRRLHSEEFHNLYSSPIIW
jgi:hypothetical protein